MLLYQHITILEINAMDSIFKRKIFKLNKSKIINRIINT
jgi:hypothetical protein